jgi:hypothetical protein
MSLHLNAQKIFSEGVIRYDVFVKENSQPEGVYVVTVKNGFTKRELAMNSGFNNVIFYNQQTGKTISLNMDDDQKYALTLSAAEVIEQNKRFAGATYTDQSESKKIAGFHTKSKRIQYRNGEFANFFYTDDLIPPTDSFNSMFPGLKGIPLEYEVKSSNNMSIRFVATKLETRSIDVSVFDIPKEYKLVTRKELEKLK